MAKKKSDNISKSEVIGNLAKDSKKEYFLMNDGSIAEIIKKFDKCDCLDQQDNPERNSTVLFRNEKNEEKLKQQLLDTDIFNSFTKKVIIDRLQKFKIIDNPSCYNVTKYVIEIDKENDLIIINSENQCPRKKKVLKLSKMTQKKSEILDYLKMIWAIDSLKRLDLSNELEKRIQKKEKLLKDISELEDTENIQYKIDYAKLELRKTEKEIENCTRDSKLKDKQVKELEKALLEGKTDDLLNDITIEITSNDEDSMKLERLNQIQNLRNTITEKKKDIEDLRERIVNLTNDLDESEKMFMDLKQRMDKDKIL